VSFAKKGKNTEEGGAEENTRENCEEVSPSSKVFRAECKSVRFGKKKLRKW